MRATELALILRTHLWKLPSAAAADHHDPSVLASLHASVAANESLLWKMQSQPRDVVVHVARM
jgi:hypothetical protein